MSNMVVQTNILALNSHRNLSITGTKQATASQKLSSGFRINSAADDAAGLAISEKMRAQIRGLDMGSKNAQDGISMVQTAEGGMQEIDNMLQRIRELVDYSANDTQEYNTDGTSDRQKIQDEIDSLVSGIDSIAGQVEFNKKKLIDGSFMSSTAKNAKIDDLKAALTKLGGAAATSLTAPTAILSAAGGLISENLTNANKVTTAQFSTQFTFNYKSDASLTEATETSTVSIVSMSAFSTSNALKSEEIEKQIKVINDYIAFRDSSSAKAADNGDTTQSLAIALSDTDRKTLEDAAQALADLYKNVTVGTNLIKTKDEVNNVNGKGLWLQVGANAQQGFNVNIGSITSFDLGIGDGKGTASLNVMKESGRDITADLNLLDKSLSFVTTERSKLGAIQNRLEYTMKSLDISSENLSSAESRIRDADMAKEMMNLTKANVLQQAGISMLTQANQAPQSILSLLR